MNNKLFLCKYIYREEGGILEPPTTPIGRDELALRRHRFFSDLLTAAQAAVEHRVRFDPIGPEEIEGTLLLLYNLERYFVVCVVFSMLLPSRELIYFSFKLSKIYLVLEKK
jgi:hypothetical protein